MLESVSPTLSGEGRYWVCENVKGYYVWVDDGTPLGAYLNGDGSVTKDNMGFYSSLDLALKMVEWHGRSLRCDQHTV